MTHTAGFAGMLRRRPPEVEVRLDLTLRNDAAGARWAVISDTLGAAPRPGEVLSLDAYELTGEGRAVVLRAVAVDGFFGVLLPAGGEVLLRGLPLTHHGPVPERAEVPVVMAAALDGARFDRPLECDAGAVVDAGELAGQETVAAVQRGPLTISWEPLATSRLEVALG